jgi:HD-GYP domain-containing protein (c-di-GMP phosphodiesterase class II)
MRERRPYRPAKSRDAAVLELERNAGTQFDPELVEPMLASVETVDQTRLRLLPRLRFH